LRHLFFNPGSHETRGTNPYADPELESLPSGQKILLRMGRENARRVKNVLQRLRDQLAAASATD
jgi:hypothetical protein